jgi:DNA-binding transcriptional MocR family regulator
MQAAWLRRFRADAESNLKAFALRLKEAMPDLVTVHESKGFFAKSGKVTAVTVDLAEQKYKLELAGSRLQASIAMVVRGITLSTKTVDPAEWFAKLAEETQKASVHAQSLSQSLAAFMAS